ncbi:CapA family protein [Candidatus Saccharibacteria bacterium]|nr:CapA family protein [Candidatus Saccharibacteria bacterium]
MKRSEKTTRATRGLEDGPKIEKLASKRRWKMSRQKWVAIISGGVGTILLIGGLIWLNANWRTIDSSGDEVAVEEPAPAWYETKVPTVSFYDARQAITSEQLADEAWLLDHDVEMVAIEDLDLTRKVLMVDDQFPLDHLLGHEEVLSFTQTGVTALTRGMIRRLDEVGGDATYFSEKIGPVLRKADVVHTSNEVSFTDNCRFTTGTTMVFCSPWAMMDAITDSGINLVELTGNHNNDYGAQWNAASINKYHELGIQTFGGGMDTAAARVPHEIKAKDSHVVVLGYNAADGPGSPALSGPNRAGANAFGHAKAKEDIEAAKAAGAFVIVHIQYSECYSYPARGTEMPACDYPIQGQQSMFRAMADYGADMVVGSSAHQPQTYEIYKGVPIYYGLGNLWFDQYTWPGNSRSLILTHYFYQGRLLSSRIQTTFFEARMQVEVVEVAAQEQFLERLGRARPKDADKLGPQTAQEVVNEWARGRNVGVYIYDIGRGRVAAELNSTRKFFSASLYKMAVVTEGYKLVQNGTRDADAVFLPNHQEVRPDMSLGPPTSVTFGGCLDLAIRRSDIQCPEALWNVVGRDKATTNMSALDAYNELRRIWDGAELNAESRAKYLDSMLNQPDLFRRGLASGFSSDVKVYNKVGWNRQQEWHDAAIVEINANGATGAAPRTYAVVVMTNGAVPGAMGFSAVRELGELLDKVL